MNLWVQTFEMTLQSRKNRKGVVLYTIKEEFQSSKSDDDEKMLKDLRS